LIKNKNFVIIYIENIKESKMEESKKYIVTRKQKRYIAKVNMKKEGLSHICKHSHTTMFTKEGKQGEMMVVPSFFAEHWREYVHREEGKE
jgi:hypothetical protein